MLLFSSGSRQHSCALVIGVHTCALPISPGGSLVLAGNYRAYDSEPLLQAAWANRWRLHGTSEKEVRAKLARIKAGAVPPESEDAVAALLVAAGFTVPERFFSSLFWGAWHARREM